MLPGGSTWLSWGPTSRSGRRCWTSCMSVCLLATVASRQLPGGRQRCLSWVLHKQSCPVCSSTLHECLVLAARASSPCLRVRCHQMPAGCDATRVHCFDSSQGCHVPLLRLHCRRGPWASAQLSGRPRNCLTPAPVTAHAVCTVLAVATLEPCRAGTEGKACVYLAVS